MADNAANQPSREGRIESKTVTLQYDMPDLPLHGCDYVNILSTPDKALVLQFFSTTPPVVNNKDGSLLTETRRRCVGQIHITPTVAQEIMKRLGEQLASLK